MNIKRKTNVRVSGDADTSTRNVAAVSKNGDVRVYFDLPADLGRKLNILAASLDKPKREVLADIVTAAVANVRI